MKEIVPSWKAVNGAGYYRVLKDPDGVSGYSHVGGEIAATSTVARDSVSEKKAPS